VERKQKDRPWKILYVEDDPDLRAVAEIALQDIGGFKTAIFESGPEALKKAAEFDPELILLDVMMPGMDGITTMLELRKIDSLETVPVIFITTKCQESDIDKYQALGALGVIPKPFDPIQLPIQITGLLEGAI
jgi:two-component system OmpR family response regulator